MPLKFQFFERGNQQEGNTTEKPKHRRKKTLSKKLVSFCLFVEWKI